MARRVENSELSNVRHISDAWLLRRGLTLYPLVGASDCLISDLSSIVADFLLLDRPIVLLFEDIDEYASSRGFSFNPITDYLPANVARTFNEFELELSSVLGGRDDCADRRAALRGLFFDYDDANAAERILKLVFEE